MNHYTIVADKLQLDLDALPLTDYHPSKRTEIAIQLVSNTIVQLREMVHTNEFRNLECEVQFFKAVKPQVFAYLIFYTTLLDIELKDMICAKEEQSKYIQERLFSFQKLLHDNLPFVRYYKSGADHLDELYFSRGSVSIRPIGVCCLGIADKKFATSHDQVVANILAHEMLLEHLEKKPSKQNNVPSSNLYWSESKVALVELIYALESSGAISNGKADIKELCEIFEKLFNFELGHIYRIFLSIKMRKTERTRFMDKLVSDLNKRLEDSEE